MVLEYLLMGHHLIPGVSGMSGMLCKLLGRGDLLVLQPAVCLGSQASSPALCCSHPPFLCGLGQKHCTLPQKTHPWATDRMGEEL